MSDERTEVDREGIPFVSVIVPVYNDPDGIRQCLEALEKQTYPDDRYEVLVVDNGSTDETDNVIREFDVTYLLEDEIQGSYAARNLGLRQATGEIVGMIDADCTPTKTWIEAGVTAFQKTEAALISGRVEFTFSRERTSAERFDASVNMRNDKAINRGVAKTANLFTRAEVVDKIGTFPEHLISGGDVYWTKTATSSGFELVYEPDAVVRHPARQLGPLLKKQYRVGKGQIQIWKLNEQSVARTLLAGLLAFPVKVFGFVLGEIDEDEGELASKDVNPNVDRSPGVYLVAGLCVLSMNFGRLVAAIYDF